MSMANEIHDFFSQKVSLKYQNDLVKVIFFIINIIISIIIILIYYYWDFVAAVLMYHFMQCGEKCKNFKKRLIIQLNTINN